MKSIKILSLITAAWSSVNSAFAQNWTQSNAPSNDWVSVASSADGSKLVAAAGSSFGGDGLIYTSTNSGADWTPTSAPTDSWTTVASSADGAKLVAAATGDSIYISTNSGFAWVPTSAPSNSWAAISSSADGSKLVAAASSDLIYFSTNSGAGWIPANAPAVGWGSIVCSADGKKAVAANGNQVWISNDSGATWTQTDLASKFWSSVASSADGNRLFAVVPSGQGFGGVPNPGCVALSTNSGVSWTTNNNFGAGVIASAADGNKLVAGNYVGISTSTDLGMTWIQETNISGSTSTACSADGNKLVVTTLATAVGFGGIPTSIPGPVYISFSRPAPLIHITPTNGNFALSWTVPSTIFVMQQSADLQNWADMTNQPVLNLTNLQDEVLLAPPGSDVFYRLKTP